MSRMPPDLSAPEPEVDQTYAAELFADLSGAMDPSRDADWDDRSLYDIHVAGGGVGDKTMWVEVKVIVGFRVPLTADEYDSIDTSYADVRDRVVEGINTAQDAVADRMKRELREGVFNV